MCSMRWEDLFYNGAILWGLGHIKRRNPAEQQHSSLCSLRVGAVCGEADLRDIWILPSPSLEALWIQLTGVNTYVCWIDKHQPQITQAQDPPSLWWF